MTRFLLHVGAGVQCAHMAPATVQTSNTRVFVGTTLVITAADLHSVAGCPFTVPGPKPQPCATIRWAPAARVFVHGQPAVVQMPGTGQGICSSAEQIPQGPPVIASLQARVTGM
ncbi:hypothetical protein QF031_000039 [Pseudarthrobacter defluvii]|uniref:hypothetical protein n=1 Tax=Pseudarthrobacter defluvii TaxID=410837 RepID=UPI00277F875A|nr:hypothetical protein [Pseudarthrobacter defluvii]MDQ0767290.1 hypothetical protein [Pseudarthrobacter defluvii]